MSNERSNERLEIEALLIAEMREARTDWETARRRFGEHGGRTLELQFHEQQGRYFGLGRAVELAVNYRERVSS